MYYPCVVPGAAAFLRCAYLEMDLPATLYSRSVERTSALPSMSRQLPTIDGNFGAEQFQRDANFASDLSPRSGCVITGRPGTSAQLGRKHASA